MEHFSETAVLILKSTLIILVVNLSKNSHNFPLHGKKGWSFSSDTTKLKSFRGSLDNTMKDFYRVLGSEIGDWTWAWQRETKQLIHMLMLSTNNESCVSSCLVCIKCIKCVQCGEDIQMLLTRTLATITMQPAPRRVSGSALSLYPLPLDAPGNSNTADTAPGQMSGFAWNIFLL